MTAKIPRTIVGGLSFTEGPRWRNGRLWFSDAHKGRVLSVNEAGDVRVEAVLPSSCSGLGWRSDGTLLVLLTQSRRLVAVDGDKIVDSLDLSNWLPGTGTEMITDADGRAYIGNAGFDFRAKEAPRATKLVMATANGEPSFASDEPLEFPNGTVITPDGRTLIIAETLGRRLTSFGIAPDGSLSHRRQFADLGEAMPDGICLDAEGAVWAASPNTRQVLRVRGGEIVDRISTGTRGAFACMLGGRDRKTLYIATGSVFDFTDAHPKLPAAIEAVGVDVPGDGFP
ncbi:MAG: SMP-30/gluconolactonase/LRE family protein [Verrucomicrobia bacterium]|nr:SMP-30/gluconolactonase/LRE family protein [Verrucomicrobiota bacterium]MBV8414341.1 SMP-30/gluconolactonase/LRE family protein [Verrucomicrobiota bacterium]